MRILIDLQGAQTASRHRGIGRYSIALAKAIIRNRGDHEVYILLSGLFPDTIDPIKADFAPILSADHIVIFCVPSSVEAIASENAWRIEAAELVREGMIGALGPDVVLIMSLFEGPYAPAITSVGRLGTTTKTAVILYDLIPLIDPKTHLDGGNGESWYYSKIMSLNNADLLLAISSSAQREAIKYLGFKKNKIVTIYSAADEHFKPDPISRDTTRDFLTRIGLRRKFILYASTFEPRKNFEGLIRAFALLPPPLRENYQLVLLTGLEPDHSSEARKLAALRRAADEACLAPDELVLPGYVSDNELVAFYSRCELFVFPSFHEGFGLPLVEAMRCGAAVIGSNTTSIPEVIGRDDALFDPHSDVSIAELIERVLTDIDLGATLRAHGLQQSKHFSWDRSAQLALRALEEIAPIDSSRAATCTVPALLQRIAGIRVGVLPKRSDLVAVANSIARNESAVARWNVSSESEGATFAVEIDAEPRAPRNLTGCYGHARRQADQRHDGVGQTSEPELEVIHHQVWLPEERPRILLLKLDHIGDFVLALDAFRLIRSTWPKAHITLVCATWNRPIAEHSGLFDTVLCCDFYPSNTGEYDKNIIISRGLEKYRALGLGVYDLAVDLRCYDDNRILLSHTAAQYRAGYAADGVKLDLAVPAGSESEITAHVGGRTMALAAAVAWTFGIPAGGARGGLLGNQDPVRQFTDGIVVGISPGTRNALRSWGRERFLELAHRLNSDAGFRIVLIGSDADRSDTQIIAESLPKADVIDLTGKLSIAELPSIFAGLDVFVGGETGTTHMAALMGVPTLCIHSGQTNVNSWRPVGPDVVTLRRNVACSPCYLSRIEECRWNKRCMDISPRRVAAEVAAIADRITSRLLKKSVAFGDEA